MSLPGQACTDCGIATALRADLAAQRTARDRLASMAERLLDERDAARRALRAIRDRTDKEYDDEMIEDVVDLVDRVLYPNRQPPPIAARASRETLAPKETP